MPTTAEMLLSIAECLLMPRYGSATGGSTTTLVDSALDEPDELYNGGTIWFLTGNNAGKTAKITSWDLPTTTFTFPTQAGACAAGDRYAVLDARYPRELLVGSLNQALKELGPFDAKNETLTVIDNEDIYTLPAGVSDIKRVQFATQATEPYTWSSPHRWWKEIDGSLHLSEYHLPPPGWAGNKIRLWYGAQHANVYADADTVTQHVHMQRIAWQAAWAAARARNARADTADPQTKLVEELAGRQAVSMQLKHPVRRMEKDETWSDLP